MRSAVVAALGAGALLLLASVALGHDLFLKLDTYFLEPHARVRIPVLNGTFFKSEGLASRRARGRSGMVQRRTRTDSDGVAEVTLDGAGRWYVKFVHMVRATQKGLDYESRWATLTFEVR